MKFTVSGSNKENGARMTLELDADSRAAAERKASNAGMVVHNVQQHGSEMQAVTAQRRQYRSGNAGKLLFLLIVVAVAAAAWYFRGRFMR